MRIISKSLESKKQEVAQIKELLDSSRLMVVIDYQGLTVAEITDLRGRLREGGSICKITKKPCSMCKKCTHMRILHTCGFGETNTKGLVDG